MNHAKVGWLLFLTILVMAAAPLFAAFYLLDDALQTSLRLGFNAEVVEVLERSSANLRTLGKLDPHGREHYRAQFEDVERLKQIYVDPKVVRASIENSLKIYFGLGLGVTLLMSLLVATVLGRRISSSYRMTLDELLHKREQVRYLQEISSWQELAKVLAHEIKNPLTPIEVLVSSLDKSHRALDSAEFGQHLLRTQVMIAEELQHLKRTVNKFADFARLPAVQLTRVDLREALANNLQALTVQLEPAQIDTQFPEGAPVEVELDSTLFRQVLTNIVRNGIEANPQQRVKFTVIVSLKDGSVEIAVANDGVPVKAELSERIFDPYVSSKSGSENMGLGLAIVRKIVIEHGGDIHYEQRHGKPTFVITLPRLRR